MGIISWIILGLIAGALAKLLMPGKDPGGIFVTMILGIVGALVGGFISTRIGFGGVSGVNIKSLIIAIAGAVIVLIIYRMIKKR